jgi:putative Holliday junction resolvase
LATLLGIDYGRKRTGLAFSDPGGRIAFPGPLLTGGEAEVLAKVAAEAASRAAQAIVVGLPRNMDGSDSKMSRAAEAFAEKLRDATDSEVVTWDERMTSLQADRAMIDADLSRGKRRQRIDSMAAQLMLQSYLDARGRE